MPTMKNRGEKGRNLRVPTLSEALGLTKKSPPVHEMHVTNGVTRQLAQQGGGKKSGGKGLSVRGAGEPKTTVRFGKKK